MCFMLWMKKRATKAMGKWKSNNKATWARDRFAVLLLKPKAYRRKITRQQPELLLLGEFLLGDCLSAHFPLTYLLLGPKRFELGEGSMPYRGWGNHRPGGEGSSIHLSLPLSQPMQSLVWGRSRGFAGSSRLPPAIPSAQLSSRAAI